MYKGSRVISQQQSQHDRKSTPLQVRKQRFQNAPQAKLKLAKHRGRPKGHTSRARHFNMPTDQQFYNARNHTRNLDHLT